MSVELFSSVSETVSASIIRDWCDKWHGCPFYLYIQLDCWSWCPCLRTERSETVGAWFQDQLRLNPLSLLKLLGYRWVSVVSFTEQSMLPATSQYYCVIEVVIMTWPDMIHSHCQLVHLQYTHVLSMLITSGDSGVPICQHMSCGLEHHHWAQQVYILSGWHMYISPVQPCHKPADPIAGGMHVSNSLQPRCFLTVWKSLLSGIQGLVESSAV